MMRFFVPAAAALCLVLGGCSSDEQKSTAESSAPAKTSEPEKFPNLATVPDQPPPSTPKVERDKLVQGLLADKAHAEYTDQKLAEDTANVAAATPPPPAPPAPEPATKPAEGESSEQTEAADKPADNPAPPAPTEVAALPADLGQPTALIYFGSDTAVLTDRDRAILTDVASQYKGERTSRVRVIGHASATERTTGAKRRRGRRPCPGARRCGGQDAHQHGRPGDCAGDQHGRRNLRRVAGDRRGRQPSRCRLYRVVEAVSFKLSAIGGYNRGCHPGESRGP